MSSIVIDRLTASLGAEMVGVNLKDAVNDQTLQEEIRNALAEYSVLTFRAQFLDDETQIAVAEFFGDTMLHPIVAALGSDNPVEPIEDSPTSLPDREGWHTDAPFLSRPPSVAVLRAVTVPPTGGDTLWVSTAAAYDLLSESMQQFFSGLHVSYPPAQGLFDYVSEHMDEQVASRVSELVGAGAEHPLVVTHPLTARRCLYFARGFAERIIELTDEESSMLWPFLDRLVSNVGIQCRWRWHEGDVVIWDEIATQHSGAADHRGETRVMRRVAAVRPPVS
jgi:taurine dioxygenase